MGLFSKKPGGTFFGNLLRGVGNAIAPGILGTGANKIEFGQTKTNAELAQQIYSGGGALGTQLGNNVGGTLTGQGFFMTANNMIMGLLAVIVLGVVLFKDRLFGKNKKYKR